MNRQFPYGVINTKTGIQDGTRNTQKGQPALVNAASFLVEVLWK